jgi:ABC-2 type transport system ATP-binding protein
VIRLKSLAKHFGKLRAVDGLDLEVAQGEFFAFLGPNAAGKTTTIKMISGLLRPSSGSVIVGGYDMLREPEKAKAQLAYVPDFPFLYDKLTATEFMYFVGDVFRMDRRKIDAGIDELFDVFHLTDYHNELTENLSHGTRQRLVIASALLHEPKILVIDEPMVGLDPRHARVVKQVLRERAQRGMTVFLSTHQLSIAEETADSIGIINRGKLIARGTVDELRQMAHEEGGMEKVFLALVDAEEGAREAISSQER